MFLPKFSWRIRFSQCNFLCKKLNNRSKGLLSTFAANRENGFSAHEALFVANSRRIGVHVCSDFTSTLLCHEWRDQSTCERKRRGWGEGGGAQAEPSSIQDTHAGALSGLHLVKGDRIKKYIKAFLSIEVSFWFICTYKRWNLCPTGPSTPSLSIPKAPCEAGRMKCLPCSKEISTTSQAYAVTHTHTSTHLHAHNFTKTYFHLSIQGWIITSTCFLL